MPVDPGYHGYPPLIQRDQYAKGGLGRWYWDFRDKIILDFIRSEDQDILARLIHEVDGAASFQAFLEAEKATRWAEIRWNEPQRVIYR